MRRALALLFLAASCGTPSTTVRPDDHAHGDGARQDRPPQHDTPPAHDTPPTRTLGADATYDELVALARRLDGSGAEVSTRGCLLAGDTFAADVAVPVRPLPSPWDDASALLAPRAGAVRVVSRWGTTPDPAGLAVAAFTTLPPLADDAPVVVLFLSSRGVWARASRGTDAPSPVAVDDVPQGVPLLAAATPPAAIVVVADAATSVSSLRALLTRLDATHVPIALGVPFPIDTHLPAPPAPASPICPNGPPPPAVSDREGDLDAASAVATLRALRPTLSACAAEAPRDGLIEVRFRVGAGGGVTDACAQRDEVGRAAVRACVVDAVRALRFAAPSPAGYVELDVPLRLTVDRAAVTHRAICE